MNININWKKFLLFFVVIGGLLLITESFWMTLGIVLLLFVVDHFLQEYDKKQAGKRNGKNQ